MVSINELSQEQSIPIAFCIKFEVHLVGTHELWIGLKLQEPYCTWDKGRSERYCFSLP